MSHGPHALPSNSPRQIFKDGCGECEYRAQSRDHGIASLDQAQFAHAWARAAAWNHGEPGDVSEAEVPLLSVLWAVQVQLEKRGLQVIGRVPDAWDLDREPVL